jgi:hypothetical protein
VSETSAKRATSTRLSFLKNGTILAAPLAAVGVPAAVIADEELKMRVARLENEAAIRELHHRWMRSVNAGVGHADAGLPDAVAGLGRAICGVVTDHAGKPDTIEVAADGMRAIGRFHCTIESETPIAEDSTVARMAREQGGGFVRRSERRVLIVNYTKTSDTWNMAKVEFENEPS